MPVYNEKETLAEIIDRVLLVSLPDGIELEIIAVDDGSSDGSWDILQKKNSEESRMRIYRHDKNQGKGAAVRTAIREARGDIALIQDADLEYNPKDYPRLLRPILEFEADVVYGSRFAASEYRRVLYFWHSFANKMLTVLSNIMTDLNLTDMETCYKVFRMSYLKTIPIRSNGFGIEPEITAKIAKRRLRIFEVPISYSGRTYNEGKKIGLKDAMIALWTILKFKVVDDLYEERYGEEILHSMESATKFSKWLMHKIKPYLRGTILEVGAGIGNNIRILLGMHKIIATDIDQEYIRILRNTYSGYRSINVIPWDISCPPSEEIPKVETVLCSNVLEHIKDEKTTLFNMRLILKEGGRIVLIVPAGEKLFCSVDKSLGHFRRYTKNSICTKLEKAGFKIDKCFSMNKIGVFGWIVNGFIFRRKSLGRFQLKVFNSFVWLLKLIDPLLPWTGLSIVVIATKSDSQDIFPNGSNPGNAPSL